MYKQVAEWTINMYEAVGVPGLEYSLVPFGYDAAAGGMKRDPETHAGCCGSGARCNGDGVTARPEPHASYTQFEMSRFAPALRRIN